MNWASVPGLVYCFELPIGMLVVATLFRDANKISFMRAATDKLLATRGLWVCWERSHTTLRFPPWALVKRR